MYLALAWLVPHETAAVSAQFLCVHHTTNAPCHFMQSHIRMVYACLAVTCHFHFWQNDRDLLRATVVTRGGGTDVEIRVSTESRPWRRQFSGRSCRDSNPRPFNRESGALTTELSPPPFKGSQHGIYALKKACMRSTPSRGFCKQNDKLGGRASPATHQSLRQQGGI